MWWLYGLGLGAAIAIAVGRELIARRGRKIVPGICVMALLLGLSFGWAIDGYMDYMRASATMRF
jgi:hypothetical protein